MNLELYESLKFIIRENKLENKLLFNLYLELKEKCELCKENMQLLKSNNKIMANTSENKTYCEALQSGEKKNSILCVKFANINSALNDIKIFVSPVQIDTKINYIKQQDNGNIIIDCDNEDSRKKLINSL